MKKEDKELLIKDLCARLPYGVKVQTGLRRNYETGETFSGIETMKPIMISIMFENGIEEYKPYLFPLSSMTEEQKEEYCSLQQKVIYNSKGPVNSDVMKYINWCYKNHIDINNLIPMGLAVDCTNLNIY